MLVFATISCTLDTTPPLQHPTYLVFVLWVKLEFFNEVTCYLTVAVESCQVKTGEPMVVLLVDPRSKHRRQEFDNLQMPTMHSHVHGIVAILYQVTTQMAGHSN